MRWGALLLAWAAAALAAEGGDAPMAHSRAERSVTGLRPELILYGGLYSGAFSAVTGVHCDPFTGEILVADAGANRIEIFDERGAPLYEFTDDEHLAEPSRVAADRRGRILVLDLDRSRIQRFSYRGEYLGPLELPGLPEGKPSFTALLVDGNGDLYVGESRSGQVLVYGEDLKLKRRYGSLGREKGQLDGIAGIAVDAERVYVASQDGVAVHVFSRAGRLLRAWGYHDAGLQNVSLPAGIAVDAAGRVVLLDTLRQEIKYFDPEGQLIDIFGGLGRLPGDVAYPTDLSMDRRGRLCVADRGNVRIQVLAPIEAGAEGAVDGPAAAPAAPGAERVAPSDRAAPAAPAEPRPMGLPPGALKAREAPPAAAPADPGPRPMGQPPALRQRQAEPPTSAPPTPPSPDP